jgi:hypothetical protein
VLPTTVMPCQYKLTYVWLNNRAAFWSKVIGIEQDRINCWIWNGRSWYLSQVMLRDIDSFICEYF